MSHAYRISISIAALVLTAAGCSRQPEAPSAASPESAQTKASDWDAFAARYIEEHFRAQPFFAVKAGRHEYDGKMPDLSASGIAREIDRLKAARAATAGFDSKALTPEQAFERDYLLAVLDEDLFWLDEAAFPFRNPAWYIGDLDPDIYLSTNYAPPEKRMAGYIGYAKAIPEIAANIRANLETPLPRSFVERAVAGFGGFAEFYRNDVPEMFAAVQDPAAQKELAQANEAAARAMTQLRDWFEAQRNDATETYALGPEVFQRMLLQTERVDVPLERLEAIGRADTERNYEALKAACGKYVPDGTLRACIDKMSANKPKGGPVQGARDQLANLKAFVEQRRIVTIPSEEEARVAEAPPYNRGNFAYINVPGPFDQGQPSTYYVAPPDPSWSPAERAGYIPGEARLLFTTVHEVWPGHFLQFLHANRNSSRIASLWVGYAYAEGWAHYTEEMMWDTGVRDGDPEAHIGQLLAALLRDVRFQCAIGLHARGMSLEECEKLFRERAFADPGNARQQAARGTYDPAYLKYTLGKLMILKLREDWRAKHPPAAPTATATADATSPWRDFHDAFLAYGGPPIPLVRSAMLGDTSPPL
ncbi:MAG: DUF885 domain-containing protein [Steroidobacteraceae bacterium]